jgi:hypothetical protein
MRLNLKALIFSSAALCATASFAASAARVNVPFDFTAKGQSYPAGTYDVSMNEQRNFVTMASKANPGNQITWLVSPAEPAKSPAVIKFDLLGSSYALKSIQLGDKITPNLDPQSKPGLSATTSISGQ